MTIKFTIIDLMLFMAAVAVYIPFFMWGFPDIPKALMLGGGMVLFLGRISQVVALQAGDVVLYERMERIHFRYWFLLAALGMLVITLRGLLSL